MKRGRPPAENPRTKRLELRMTPEEHAALHANAEREGVSMAELIRRRCCGEG